MHEGTTFWNRTHLKSVSESSPEGQIVNLPFELSGEVVIFGYIWNATSGQAHQLQSIGVQLARHLELEKGLHLPDLSTHGSRDLVGPLKTSWEAIEPTKISLIMKRK